METKEEEKDLGSSTDVAQAHHFKLEKTDTAIPIVSYTPPDICEPFRTLGYWDCVCIVITNIIGSGIFASPGVALQRIGSPVLLAWTLSGILSTAAALCYAELGAMLPSNGADYTYLRRSYGEYASFSHAFFMFWINAPGFVAIVATGKFSCHCFECSLFVVLVISSVKFFQIDLSEFSNLVYVRSV
jgi:amino acid permease